MQRTAADPSYDGRPMDQSTALVGDLHLCYQWRRCLIQLSVLTLLFSLFIAPQELKAVLLGSGLKCFPLEWRSQAFTFSEMHDLRYGIVQKKVVLTTQLRINPSSLWSGFQTLSCLCFNFLGWSLWSSGICPSLCTENASVRMPPRHWYRPSVSYLSILLWHVRLTPPCPVVIAWMPFTDISSHQWLPYSTAKYWPLLGGISMLFTQLWLCSQEVKTFQHHQKKVSCEGGCRNPLEGWRGKTGHSCHVRSHVFQENLLYAVLYQQT